MINTIKTNLIYIFLIILFIYKGSLTNIVSNVNDIITNRETKENIKAKVLENQNKELKEEIYNLTNIKLDKDINISKLSYIDPYEEDTFYIYGNYNKNDYVLKNETLIGTIKETFNNYSKVILLNKSRNLPIKINNTYGTITSSNKDYLIADNISNKETININDKVYLNMDESILIGKIAKIETKDINKIIYITYKNNLNDIKYVNIRGIK